MVYGMDKAAILRKLQIFIDSCHYRKDTRHADCYTELNGTQLHTDKLVLVVEQKIIFVRLKGCFRVLIDLFIVVFGKVSIFP